MNDIIKQVIIGVSIILITAIIFWIIKVIKKKREEKKKADSFSSNFVRGPDWR